MARTRQVQGKAEIAACRTRTCNPQLRRLMLYPIELRLLLDPSSYDRDHRASTASNPQLAKPQACDHLHRAYSTVRTSLSTVTLISPGYCNSDSIFLAMSRANFALERSSMR